MHTSTSATRGKVNQKKKARKAGFEPARLSPQHFECCSLDHSDISANTTLAIRIFCSI